MRQRTKSISILFSAVLSFILVYQVLLCFLDNEDGISITFISASSPFWAYFIDGYHIICTVSWLVACSIFWFFSFSFVCPIKRNMKIRYKFYTVAYNILLYCIAMYILTQLTSAEMPMRMIPCILAIILFGIVYVVHRATLR
ncbi:MAG: hypothetical protein K2M30_04065 [Desulfovibrionaceae bacterium]|nr:hypothetical protein [Desulfovibrionaceae bacterium]